MRLTLTRFRRSNRATLGRLELDGSHFCFTLEDPVRPAGIKIPGSTAIPAGTYPVQITFSPRFQQRMPLLVGVPNFSGVRIHPGNKPEDTEGCVLVGYTHTDDDWIGDSRKAYQALYQEIQDALDSVEPVSIEIVNQFEEA
jgi:hypothetical protein